MNLFTPAFLSGAVGENPISHFWHQVGFWLQKLAEGDGFSFPLAPAQGRVHCLIHIHLHV